mgnify:CR=1 FL=1
MTFPIFLFILLILDQGTKAFARRRQPLLVGFCQTIPGCDFRYIENRGFLLHIFSRLGSKRIAWIHGLIITGFSCFLIYSFSKGFDTMEKAGVLLLYAGGLGNGIDRWFRGSVTDFLLIRRLKIIANLADLYLFAGSILLILWGLSG